MKTIVIGLGNPILSDDGVGIYIARELMHRLKVRDVDIIETSTSGLYMLDLLKGYDRAILIDAIQTIDGKAGQIYELEEESFRTSCHSTNPHDIDIVNALDLARKLNLPVPDDIKFYAVEVENVTTFSEKCSPEVVAAINTCTETIMKALSCDESIALGKQ